VNNAHKLVCVRLSKDVPKGTDLVGWQAIEYAITVLTCDFIQGLTLDNIRSRVSGKYSSLDIIEETIVATQSLGSGMGISPQLSPIDALDEIINLTGASDRISQEDGFPFLTLKRSTDKILGVMDAIQ
jgi:hypothetical protein